MRGGGWPRLSCCRLGWVEQRRRRRRRRCLREVLLRCGSSLVDSASVINLPQSLQFVRELSLEKKYSHSPLATWQTWQATRTAQRRPACGGGAISHRSASPIRILHCNTRVQHRSNPYSQPRAVQHHVGECCVDHCAHLVTGRHLLCTHHSGSSRTMLPAGQSATFSQEQQQQQQQVRDRG